MIDNADKLVGPVVDAGVVHVLVDTLEDESPFCVAAAAGVLGFVARAEGRGQTLFAASGAIPALLRVIEREIPIGNGDLYPKCGHHYQSMCLPQCHSECRSEACSVTPSTVYMHMYVLLLYVYAYVRISHTQCLTALSVTCVLRAVPDCLCANLLHV